MAIALKRIGVYLRLALTVIVALGVAVVFFNNRKHDTDVWFFYQFQKVNVVWVMLVTAGVSVVSFWILIRVRGVIRDLRQIQAENRERRLRQEQEQVAKKLDEQERRIDQKLQGSLSQELSGQEPSGSD